MEKLFKNQRGEWKVSEWKGDKRSFTGADGHTYTEIVDNATDQVIVEHNNCWCFNE